MARGKQNICGTCKYWDNDKKEEYGECDLIDHETYGDFAYTQDYEDYRSWLKTRKDFGCILWKPEND